MAEYCDDISTLFSSAADYLPSLVPSLEQNQLLQFYAFYKQATVGKCDIPKPGWYSFEARKKWEAWNNLGDLTKEESMERYVELLDEVKPDWRTDKKLNKGFVAVSRMTTDELCLEDSEKSVFDWVKEGRAEKVLEAKGSFDVNAKDEEGMALIHWAADRGHAELVELLLDLNADINLVDDTGQTALHYAAACDHNDVVKLLLGRGADPFVQCQDGNLPSEITSDEKIKLMICEKVKP